MSMENFLSFLQQLLTMVESNNISSIALAKTALVSTIGVARSSGKVDAITLRSMMIAEQEFEVLVRHRDDFAGVPGEYQKNQVKRQRLVHMIRPGC